MVSVLECKGEPKQDNIMAPPCMGRTRDPPPAIKKLAKQLTHTYNQEIEIFVHVCSIPYSARV